MPRRKRDNPADFERPSLLAHLVEHENAARVLLALTRTNAVAANELAKKARVGLKVAVRAAKHLERYGLAEIRPFARGSVEEYRIRLTPLGAEAKDSLDGLARRLGPPRPPTPPLRARRKPPT